MNNAKRYEPEGSLSLGLVVYVYCAGGISRKTAA